MFSNTMEQSERLVRQATVVAVADDADSVDGFMASATHTLADTSSAKI